MAGYRDQFFDDGAEIPLDLAEEMAKVGAVPLGPDSKAGDIINLAGQNAVLIRTIDRKAFLDLVRHTLGMEKALRFAVGVPSDYQFFTISTD